MAHVHLPSVNYRLFSFVNVRSMLEPSVAKENVGCFVSMVGGIHRVGPDRDFSDLARECKKELDDAIVRGYDKKTEEDMSRPMNFFLPKAP